MVPGSIPGGRICVHDRVHLRLVLRSIILCRGVAQSGVAVVVAVSVRGARGSASRALRPLPAGAVLRLRPWSYMMSASWLCGASVGQELMLPHRL